MANLLLTRDNCFVPKYEKDKFEVCKNEDGNFSISIDEPIHGLTDNGMSTNWELSKTDAKLLADFLLHNLEK